jgi:predicted nucleic acid-binding protein
MILFDTCAIIDLFENNKEGFLLRDDIAVCSFNRDELTRVTHRHELNTHLKHRIRKFFESFKIKIIDVPVTPGNFAEEKKYVSSINKELLKLIPDPSDAVLAACALHNNASIITKDRHHLYTAKLENMFNKEGIRIEKKL